MINATVVLKTGQKLATTYEDDKRFTATSLTANVVHRLPLVGGGNAIVQGDNIAYIEVK